MVYIVLSFFFFFELYSLCMKKPGKRFQTEMFKWDLIFLVPNTKARYSAYIGSYITSFDYYCCLWALFLFPF